MAAKNHRPPKKHQSTFPNSSPPSFSQANQAGQDLQPARSAPTTPVKDSTTKLRCLSASALGCIPLRRSAGGLSCGLMRLANEPFTIFSQKRDGKGIRF